MRNPFLTLCLALVVLTVASAPGTVLPIERMLSSGAARAVLTTAVSRARPDKVSLDPGGRPVLVTLAGTGLDRDGLRAVVLCGDAPDRSVKASLQETKVATSRGLLLGAIPGATAGILKVRLEWESEKIDVPLTVRVAAAASPALARKVGPKAASESQPAPSRRGELAVLGTSSQGELVAGATSSAQPSPAVKGALPEAGKLRTPPPPPVVTGAAGATGAAGPASGAVGASGEKAFGTLLADVGKLPPEQRFQFGSRQVSVQELREALQKGRKNAVSLRQGTAEDLRAQVERQGAATIAEKNRLALGSLKSLKSATKSSELAATVPGMTAAVVLPPRIDSIHNEQPAYSPGMYIVARGAHFNTYTYQTTSWGITSTEKSPPTAGIRYRGGPHLTEQTKMIEVITEGEYVTSPEFLLAKFPDDLGGLFDQPVRLFVIAGPPNDRKESNEHWIRFEPKRVVKELEPGDVTTFFCNDVLTSSGGCDHEGERWDNLSICLNYTYSYETLGGAVNGQSCGPARSAAYDAVKNWPFRTLHEGRCLYGQDSFCGADLYQIPLYNEHEVLSITHGYGGGGSVTPVYHGPAVQQFIHLLEMDFTIEEGGYGSWYGFRVQVVGPAGIPYQEEWKASPP
jgi:hypothetical protein